MGIGLLLLVVGLILDLAGASWFHGAETVGVILIVVGGILVAIQLLVLAGVATSFKKYL